MKKFQEAYAEQYISDDVRPLIIDNLKNALKEEFCAWYGYTIVKDWLVGTCRPDIVKLYEDTAKDELEDHAFWLMKRINELGGDIDDLTDSPAAICTAKHAYRAPIWSDKQTKYTSSIGQLDNQETCDDCPVVPQPDRPKVISIQDSLMTNISNELDAIDTYKNLIALTEGVDWTTNKKCKEILADEE